jgi:hypothetical protein
LPFFLLKKKKLAILSAARKELCASIIEKESRKKKEKNYVHDWLVITVEAFDKDSFMRVCLESIISTL